MQIEMTAEILHASRAHLPKHLNDFVAIQAKERNRQKMKEVAIASLTAFLRCPSPFCLCDVNNPDQEAGLRCEARVDYDTVKSVSYRCPSSD